MEFGLDPATLIITLVSIIISLTVHEAMHAFVGLKLGDTTAHEQGRVSFNPLRHIDPFATVLLPLITLLIFKVPILAAKPVPFNPDRVKYDEFGAALIAAAGPASNFVLAALAAVVLHFVGGSASLYNALTMFAAINVGIFIFNLVPIPPLDGSRVLYAFAPEPVQDFMRQIEPMGFFIVFGLVLAVPGFSNLLIHLNTNVLYWLIRV